MNEIVDATEGCLLRGSPTAWVTGVSTDSRRVKRGELFVALRGDRFDGHDFIGKAVRRGAAGVVVDRRGAFSPARNVVKVQDTLRALGDLAGNWRRRFPIPVVAITGSNGKTTTKEMVSSVLARRYRVLKTEGNLNNLIGLPVTLFRLHRRIELAVVEMGMNAPGEIRRLAEIAGPQVGVITNVGRAHLEGLGTLARVARAKGELLEKLPPDGLAILNGDSRFTGSLARISPAPVVRFGLGPKNEVRGLHISFDDLKGVSFRVASNLFHLPSIGLPNVANALAAVAVGRHFGTPVTEMQKALKGFRGEHQRMELVRLPNRIDLIDDSYNANPDSMEAALDLLRRAGSTRRKVAVLGEMLELGRFAPAAHRDLGREVARAGVQLLLAAGPHATDLVRTAHRSGVRHAWAFGSSEEIGAHLPSLLRKGDLVLVKGSRGMRMESVVDRLKRRTH